MLADVRRGIWQPPTPAPAVMPQEDPIFHEFATDWFVANEREWAPHTAKTYRGLLSNHLLPFLHERRLSQITVAEVDRYREAKVREAQARDAARAAAKPGERPPRRLGATTINKTLILLGEILAVAEERELIARNPMRVNPRRRKVRAVRPGPVHLDSAEHIAAMLDAAGALDAEPDALTGGRRAMIATLLLAGLRLGEVCALRWRDVDLANGRLHVGRSKTDAGVREVDMLPALRDELATHKAASTDTGPDIAVFVTRTGRARDVDNARQRVVQPVVAAADELLAQREQPPLPEGVTAHKLRHTYASILAALNRPMPDVIAQLGHTDAGFTLRVYAHVMRRGEDERARLG